MAKLKILSTRDRAEWSRCLDSIHRGEIVHSPQYSRIYERYGDGVAECAIFEDGENLVLYPYLRRDIADSNGLTDIITPYGYGGAVWSCGKGRDSGGLIADFRIAFVEYARQTRTVSEFVRFHPFLQNHRHFQGLMDEVSLSCVNALIDLSVGADALFAHYRTSYKQCIRKAETTGLTVKEMGAPDFIEPFFALYSASMQRKGQKGYLRFHRDFLDKLSEELGESLKCFAVMYESQIIAIALFLKYRKYVDYFLAASNPEFLVLRPNHLLLHSVALWAIGQGADWFHLGGGHPSLQFFKHGFANQSRDYYVGKHVFDRAVYDKLAVEHWRRHGRDWSPEEMFFPAYRAEVTHISETKDQ